MCPLCIPNRRECFESVFRVVRIISVETIIEAQIELRWWGEECPLLEKQGFKCCYKRFGSQPHGVRRRQYVE